jgi:hypothetical protein
VERAQQNRGSSSGRTRDTPSGPITTAILELVIVPQRPAHIRRAEGKYTPEECDRADCISRNWASAWLTGGTDNESDIVEWIRVAQGRHLEVAAKLSNAGLTPGDAELRLGFGRIDPSRDTIIDRIIRGNLGFKDAVRQVKDYRHSQRSTGT